MLNLKKAIKVLICQSYNFCSCVIMNEIILLSNIIHRLQYFKKIIVCIHFCWIINVVGLSWWDIFYQHDIIFLSIVSDYLKRDIKYD